MDGERIVVARIWHQFRGTVDSRAEIIYRLNPKRFKVIIIHLLHRSDAENEFARRGYPVYYISRKKYYRLFDIGAIWKLLRILKREQVDIVHCHRHQATVYGSLAASRANVPVVLAHVHGLNRSKKRRRFINRIVYPRISKFLTVGEAVKEDVLKGFPWAGPEQVVSVGNCIDVTRFQVDGDRLQMRHDLGIDDETFVFGTVGRLVPTKGYSFLIDAFAKVCQVKPNAMLLFIGEGRSRDELMQQAQATGCGDRIRFLGQREDIPLCLQGMDAFVLSSVAEGMPRCLMEAMASGLPCVVTDAGEMPTMVEQGDCGIVAEKGNIESLAAAMQTMMGMSPDQRTPLAEKAKEKALREYAYEPMVQRIENIYEEQLQHAIKQKGRLCRK